MSNVFDNAPDDQVPTFDEMAGNMPGFVLGQNDRAEIDAWYQANETPLSDAELDQQWAAEMERRDAEQQLAEQSIDRPVLPVRREQSNAEGFYNLIDALGRLVESVHGSAEANRRLRRLNASA